jgi:hypothetical protein
MNYYKSMENPEVREIFIDLIGEDNINYIEKSNWVKYERNPFEIYKRNEIEIIFLEQDNKKDTVIFFHFIYDEDLKKFKLGTHFSQITGVIAEFNERFIEQMITFKKYRSDYAKARSINVLNQIKI